MMVRTFLETGGSLIQFNIISTDTLRKAQINPEKYKDLWLELQHFLLLADYVPPCRKILLTD